MDARAAARLALVVLAAVLLARDARAQDADAGADSDAPSDEARVVHASRAPRIDYVVPIAQQPWETAPETVWYDDFDDDARQALYAEKGGTTTAAVRMGVRDGKSLEMRYAKGSRGTGGRKVFFGDSPTYRQHTLRKDEKFTDIHWRIYVKHQDGWTGGGPAKLSRATSLVPPGWRQAMIAHVWSQGDALTLDPATGVRGGKVVTTVYNDFDNLRWLGNRPASTFRLHSEEESGRWVCVEARARLNTPGKKDGLQQLWIDGRLECERTELDWRGTFDERGINAVFLEAYWNDGSPVDQSRWIEEFVISTKPIGPVICARHPVLLRTPHRGDGQPPSWHVEIAAGTAVPRRPTEGAAAAAVDIVWRSAALPPGDRVRVHGKTGTFLGSRNGKTDLEARTTHFVRIRESTAGAAWSDWHQPFVTTR